MYVTTFDITQAHFIWWSSIASILITVLFVAVVSKNHFQLVKERSIKLLAVIVALYVLYSVFGDLREYQIYNNAQTILKNDRASVVEGPIANFQPSNAVGGKIESFTVNNVRFNYNVADITNPGFKAQSGLNGILHKGLWVRIYYYYDSSRDQDVILKLEIKQ